LERARFRFLPELAGCESILVLGEGDGRCVARLVQLAPQARIDCIELSPAMVAHAAARLRGRIGADRVHFITGDIFAQPLTPAAYDAVVTFFFLDCFSTAQVAELIGRVGRSLRPGARWLWADFVEPARGWRRWRARLWLAVLYASFRWGTGLQTRVLPEAEAALVAGGWRAVHRREFQQGLLRSAVFMRAAP
jgi:SAM-dependent methyltransferase